MGFLLLNVSTSVFYPIKNCLTPTLQQLCLQKSRIEYIILYRSSLSNMVMIQLYKLFYIYLTPTLQQLCPQESRTEYISRSSLSNMVMIQLYKLFHIYLILVWGTKGRDGIHNTNGIRLTPDSETVCTKRPKGATTKKLIRL